MYSRVVQHRVRGKKRKPREIDGDPGVLGEVRIAGAGSYRKMTVFEWGDLSHMKPLVPALINPEVLTMLAESMLVRGFQRDESGGWCLQEWTVTFLGFSPGDAKASGRE